MYVVFTSLRVAAVQWTRRGLRWTALRAHSQKGEKTMFGKMNAKKMIEVGRGCDLSAAIQALVGDTQAEARVWIEFPASLLVLMTTPGEENGALFVLDREPGVWYWLYLCGTELRGYRAEEIGELRRGWGLLSLVEQPGLLRTGLQWTLALGTRPVVEA
jgi:hypothetical protein